MARSGEDAGREERIRKEIIADAYGEEEQALGWYAYLDDGIAHAAPSRAGAGAVRSAPPAIRTRLQTAATPDE